MVAVVRKILTRARLDELFGVLLLSAGLLLAGWLGVRLARLVVDRQLARQAAYLLVAAPPVLDLPPATPWPTATTTPLPTLTPTPTATPLPPLPAIRLSIPAINLNASIQEVFPVEKVAWNGEKELQWGIAEYAVGHYNTSGYPGQGTNIVLTSHNNTLGEVFRDLDQLHPGDEVILFTEEREFHYRVQKVYLLPYLGVETQGEAALREYTRPQPTEMVTLVSCWPYATNANRIVVIAVPAGAAP
jgi:sortase A